MLDKIIITGHERVVINIVSLTLTFFSSLLKARSKDIPKNNVNNVAIKKFELLIPEDLISMIRGKTIATPNEVVKIPIKNKTILKLII